ncbi:MAG: hypothetical protein A3F78_00940 [Burkholderiales bacterium RIFCSPLOWO2_12_FULL_61_40]|nr:MAG: hypothetical protein A3F78_00940 [Burkholderiales bacterium RIFCSPLOWO2_12_FULL_61_40]
MAARHALYPRHPALPLVQAAIRVFQSAGGADARQALQPWRAHTLLTARGIPVGERRPVFALQTPSA